MEKAKRVVVLEKTLAVGLGGVVSDGVRKSLSGIALKGYTVIAGLGGRSITKRSLLNLLKQADRDELEPLSFLDLNWDVVNREIERGKQQALRLLGRRRLARGVADVHAAQADGADAEGAELT